MAIWSLFKNGLGTLKTKFPPKNPLPDFVLRGPNTQSKVIKLSCVWYHMVSSRSVDEPPTKWKSGWILESPPPSLYLLSTNSRCQMINSGSDHVNQVGTHYLFLPCTHCTFTSCTVCIVGTSICYAKFACKLYVHMDQRMNGWDLLKGLLFPHF